MIQDEARMEALKLTDLLILKFRAMKNFLLADDRAWRRMK
jgi:hypothetical protein